MDETVELTKEQKEYDCRTLQSYLEHATHIEALGDVIRPDRAVGFAAENKELRAVLLAMLKDIHKKLNAFDAARVGLIELIPCKVLQEMMNGKSVWKKNDIDKIVRYLHERK